MGEDSERPASNPTATSGRSGEQGAGSSTTGRAGGDTARVSRRRLLRDGGSVAAALGLTQLFGVDRYLAPPGGTVEIETALVHPDAGSVDAATLEVETRTVPAAWHARVSAALDLHARLVRTRIPGYLNSAVVPGSYDDGTARLSIGVRPGDLRTAPRTLEELVRYVDLEWRGVFDGVDVRVEETDPLGKPDDATGTLDEYLAPTTYGEALPGGIRCETGQGMATLFPALHHENRPRPLFGTALHAFGDDGSVPGRPITVPTTSDETGRTVGHVIDPLPDSDVAIAAPVRGTTPGSAIGRRGAVPIRGQLTRWGLADRIARGVELLKIGGTSGRTTGYPHGFDAATCITTDRCRRGQLTWGTEMAIADGDSGSVAVDPEPDEADGALVASINSARTWWPGQNHVWGVAAHELYRTHGYHF